MSSATVFMYHDVRDDMESKYKDRYSLRSFLTIQQFVSQIKYIKYRYKVISSAQFYDMGNNINDNYAVLTFDDGLLDHYTNVLPILNYYNLPATFLLAVEPVMGTGIIHSHKIQFIMACADNEKQVVDSIFDKLNLSKEAASILWQGFSISCRIDNWWTKEMVFITNFLRQGTETSYTITNELFDEYVTKDYESFNSQLYLSEKQIKKFVDAGMTIGGHGYTSENLLLLNGVDKSTDIVKSLDFINPFLKDNFISFSYPNGAYDDDAINTLRINGCSIAYTTEEKTVTSDMSIDYLKIPRLVL